MRAWLRERAWIAAAALLLAGWLLFWYLPRPLSESFMPLSDVMAHLWTGEDETSAQMDEQALRAVLEGCRVRPAFANDHFPYQMDRRPLSIDYITVGRKPGHIVAGPGYAVIYSSGNELVWPCVDGERVWQELSALLPQED